MLSATTPIPQFAGPNESSALRGYLNTLVGLVNAQARQVVNQQTPNVAQFGAKGDGAADDTPAFQEAINSGATVIRVPTGNYNVGALTGASDIYWCCDGALNVTGSAPLSLPGIVDSIFHGRRTILHNDGDIDETALLQISRATTYTGGTAGHVNTALYVTTTTVGPETQFEWAGLFKLDNSAVAGENVAAYAQAIKRSTGPTWASVSELRDKTVDPVGSAVAHEFDIFANGTDNNSNRIVQHLVVGRDDGGGSQCVVSWASRITAQANSALNGKVKTGYGVDITFDTSAFDASGGTQGPSGAAFRMATNQKMVLDGAIGSASLSYDGAYNQLTGGLSVAGPVKFGAFAAKGAEAFSGYITIKDAGGTDRKVMVCA